MAMMEGRLARGREGERRAVYLNGGGEPLVRAGHRPGRTRPPSPFKGGPGRQPGGWGTVRGDRAPGPAGEGLFLRSLQKVPSEPDAAGLSPCRSRTGVKQLPANVGPPPATPLPGPTPLAVCTGSLDPWLEGATGGSTAPLPALVEGIRGGEVAQNRLDPNEGQEASRVFCPHHHLGVARNLPPTLGVFLIPPTPTEEGEINSGRGVDKEWEINSGSFTTSCKQRL